MVKMDWCKSRCPKWLVVRKCCFCVPIRKGITIFGYVNLILSLLSFPLLIFLLVEHLTSDKPPDNQQFSVDPNNVHLPLTIAFVIIDVIMTIVMLIGAHRKNKVLLKIYFYFGVVFQLVTLCVDLAYFDMRESENLAYFFFLSLNVYLLFLVYNTVHLIEESSEVQYIAYQDHQNQSQQTI